MDFFDRQDRARKNTRLLVLFFVLAVVLIVAAVYLATLLIFFGFEAQSGSGAVFRGLWQPALAVVVAVATLSVIGGGSLYKVATLAGGGEVVARSLGGRPIDPATADLAERRILNVVEEMALASGTPVPSVFVLEREDGINAFAAGFSPGDAVVGVTAGALRQLTREELQGVVGHEFSHILNGDMHLNLRLMGVLHGILVIALIGYGILRSAPYRSGRRGKKGGGAAVLLFGLSLAAIGWIGVFFGRLIKSGVSRQRELLADAAAVQFTRNPLGLAGALKKIGGLGQGSRLHAAAAESASHLFFANGIGQAWAGFLSTHPPLAERIRLLDPAWDGTFPAARPVPEAAEVARAAAPTPRAAAGAGAAAVPLAPAAVAATVGRPSPEHLLYAAALLDGLPPDLADAARRRASAPGLVYALLLDRDPEVRAGQLAALAQAADAAGVEAARRLLPAADGCAADARLALVELALPALRRMSPQAFERFAADLRALVEADGRLSLFEFALERLLSRHLAPHFEGGRPAPAQYYSLGRLGRECAVLLSALARLGDGEPEAAAAAFAAGAAALPAGLDGLRLLPPEESDLEAVGAALAKLALAAPRLQRTVLTAATAAVHHDGRVTADEGVLLRAIADALGCPWPPLLPAPAAAA